MNCNPRIETNNSTSLFTQVGINCTNDPSVWWAEDQPSYVSDKSDPNGNYGKCLGYISVPAGSQCAGSFWSVSRICRCDTPSSSPSTFGAGYSNGMITTEEKWIFEQVLAPGDVGVLTHFWITYGTSVDNGVIVRYYIDSEKNASIQFTPSLACGVGYYDYHGPWGTKWFGKGANDAGWFNNFRIPFQKSIVVTVQHLYGNFSGFYMIVRGSINIPISVGGITLPKNARMNQFVINGTYQPLEFVPLVNISSGPGVHWMVTISAGSNNLNFLEGCFHAYFDGNNAFPGVVLSTGTEDYFDSAWYFNAGQFHLPVSGFTHFNLNNTSVTWSAYRFHEMDPLFFKHGFQFVWRIGDIDDAAGMKCMMLTGSNIAGSPGPTEVIAYAWERRHYQQQFLPSKNQQQLLPPKDQQQLLPPKDQQQFLLPKDQIPLNLRIKQPVLIKLK
uniref:Uncharacterized protein n=1 Tax=Acrobeloides nanus TaxID=290746 RepID=A0A914DUT4_9BILA